MVDPTMSSIGPRVTDTASDATARVEREVTLDELRSRLTSYLTGHSTEHAPRSPGPLAVLTGGRASSLYTFTLRQAGSGDAPAPTSVLKMYAPDERGRAHATREWRALTHLRAVDYPVPRVVLLEADARHLGHPFIVMDHVPGAPFWNVVEAADPVARARLTRSFVAQLVALHALDPHLLEPAAATTHPYGYIDHELDRLRRDSASSPHAALAGIVEWLERRKQAVPCERPAILHRDYHPWNVLVDAADDLWVIDWDWRIGDARFDLAWTCMLLRRSDLHAFSGAVRDEYARRSGRPLDDLAYFEVLTTVRWLLNVLPSVESDASSDTAARADFRLFLVGPVQRARAFLREHTGVDVNVRLNGGTGA